MTTSQSLPIRLFSQIAPKEYLFRREIACDAHSQSRFWYTKLSRPFCDCQVLAVIGNAMILGLIIALFDARRPSAIIWGVWAIIVDTVNTVFRRRPCAHIGIEVFERVTPTVADGDSPTTIFAVRSIVGLIAANIQLCPGVIFRAARETMLARRYFCGLAQAFPCQAPTAFGRSTAKVASSDDGRISAIASTFPEGTMPLPCNVRGAIYSPDDGVTAKFLSSQVNESWIGLRGIMEGHRKLAFLVSSLGTFRDVAGALSIGCYSFNYITFDLKGGI